jgi:hypothetical protein
VAVAAGAVATVVGAEPDAKRPAAARHVLARVRELPSSSIICCTTALATTTWQAGTPSSRATAIATRVDKMHVSRL